MIILKNDDKVQCKLLQSIYIFFGVPTPENARTYLLGFKLADYESTCAFVTPSLILAYSLICFLADLFI